MCNVLKNSYKSDFYEVFVCIVVSVVVSLVIWSFFVLVYCTLEGDNFVH
jgi:ABC-type transport system involved in cytochrome c biogenesis permease subunit